MALVVTVTWAVPVLPVPAVTLIGVVFRANPLSKKVMVPVGTTEPVCGVTVAVNVTDWLLAVGSVGGRQDRDRTGCGRPVVDDLDDLVRNGRSCFGGDRVQDRVGAAEISRHRDQPFRRNPGGDGVYLVPEPAAKRPLLQAAEGV